MLVVGETIQQGRRPLLVGRQLAHMPDQFDDLVGAGDDSRAGTQQHMAPTDADEVTGPGTAQTPRPSARAHAAVLAAPLRAPASTTTVAPDKRSDEPVAGQEPVPLRAEGPADTR